MESAFDGQSGRMKNDKGLQQFSVDGDCGLLEDPSSAVCKSIKDAMYLQFPTFDSFQEAYGVGSNEGLDVSPTLHSSGPEESLKNSSNYDQDQDQDDLDAKERKRAQNRAAQKAFRERREAKLKELQQKLNESEEGRKALAEEIRSLKQLQFKQQKIGEEDGLYADSKHTYSFPSPNEFYDTLIESKQTHGEFQSHQERYLDQNGTENLPIAAAWEYLHSLLSQRDFDIYAVMQSLKGREVCHGRGAAYPKSLIDQVVEFRARN